MQQVFRARCSSTGSVPARRRWWLACPEWPRGNHSETDEGDDDDDDDGDGGGGGNGFGRRQCREW